MTGSPQDLLNAYYIARSMAWRYRLDAYEDEALASIAATVDAARREIVREFEQRLLRTDASADRAQAILEELEDMTLGVRQQLNGDIGEMASVAGQASLTEHAAMLSMDGLVAINTVALAPAQLESFLISTPLDGHKLGTWLDLTFDATVQREMKQALNVGALRGEGYRKLVDRLDGAFQLTKREAINVARTYVTAASSEAARSVQEANADILEGWRWQTVADNRVCILCMPLHGRVFKMDDKNAPTPPRHVRCRCCRTPKPKSWRSLGIPIDDIEQTADRWVVRGKMGQDGKVVVRGVGTGGKDPILDISFHKTADDWFKSLTPAQQAATGLGPGRVKLLREGKVKVADLIGKDFEPRTLKELGA